MFANLEMPHLPNRIRIMKKLGILKYSNIKEWGISRKKHVIDFEMGTGPKMNMFDFGLFQNFRAFAACDMSSRAKTSFICFLGHFKEPPVV